jgi:hypothetical protein
MFSQLADSTNAIKMALSLDVALLNAAYKII